MLYARFYHVREGQVVRLREWMQEISRRRDEALASYIQEGTRHELAYLIEAKGGPVLIYLAEVQDPDKARQAFRESGLSIDREHREVMRQVVAGRAETELLYDCAVTGEGS